MGFPNDIKRNNFKEATFYKSTLPVNHVATWLQYLYMLVANDEVHHQKGKTNLGLHGHIITRKANKLNNRLVILTDWYGSLMTFWN